MHDRYGLGVQALAEGGFDLLGRGDFHVLHHVNVGLEEVPEVVGEAPLRLLKRLVGLLDPLYPRRRVGEHLVRAALRLADGELSLPPRALADVLGLAVRARLRSLAACSACTSAARIEPSRSSNCCRRSLRLDTSSRILWFSV